MKYILLPVCIFLAVSASAQDNGRSMDTAKPVGVHYVERMPDPGFDMNSYFAKNLHYPKAAMKDNIEGRVIVKFLVNENGSISDCRVVRGIGSGCDEEALRLIKNMPHWNPGKQDGEHVKVWFTVPVVFSLTK